MAYNNFVPQLWAEKIDRDLNQNCVYAEDTNRQYEGTVKKCGDTVRITGVEKLHGTTVKAHDLRAGAALVIAGLAAEGDTVVENIHYIERGYENLIGKLTALGADICRIQD